MSIKSVNDSSRISEEVRNFVCKTFKSGKDRSAAHDFGHVERVADGAYSIVKALGGTEREAEMARAGGYLHDLVRSRTELIDDEMLSVKKARPMLHKLVKSGIITMQEADTIIAAIITKSVPEQLLSSSKKDRLSYFLNDRTRLVRLAVFFADKIDANGAFSMARRAQFVGGERFYTGDLKSFKQHLDSEGNVLAKQFDPELAILLESYLRLGLKNNQYFYPKWFRSVVDRLYAKQKEFYFALLAHRGLREADVARMLIDTNFPGAKVSSIVKWESKRPDSDRMIDAVTPEQVNAALEIIEFFGVQKNLGTDTAALVREFRPRNKKAKEWRREMVSYLDGGMDALLKSLRLPPGR
jgi:hypothetical protein